MFTATDSINGMMSDLSHDLDRYFEWAMPITNPIRQNARNREKEGEK